MSSSDSLDSAFYAPTFFSSAWAAVGGWGRTSCWGRSTSPYIAAEALMSTLAKAFATSLAINIYMGCFNEDIDLILHDRHLIVLQNEGWSRCRLAPRQRP